MKLIHTLLLLFRENCLSEDMRMAANCLKSLEKSGYTTVVVCNQGCLNNIETEQFLKNFSLNTIVIGNAEKVGIVVGRQNCFNYVWTHFPEVEYISELHLDMFFTPNWELPLTAYLDENDEPVISCGIVDQHGISPFIDVPHNPLPPESLDTYLQGLIRPEIVHGFTHPCIHKSKILKEIGGYNVHYLTGKQAFEDDSILLSYYYYYGTRINWKPKVNYNSVVYHAVAGQRLTLNDSFQVNYQGLVRQYGGMGLKHLSMLHKSPWHINFFAAQCHRIENP